QEVPRLAYPRYLDNFDNAGLGIWWMPTTKTAEQMEWMKNFPAVANLHGQSLEMTPAPNVYDISGPDNAIAQLRKIGKTYRHMLWTGSGNVSWLNWLNLPGRQAEVLAPGFTGRRFFEAGGYQTTQIVSPLINNLIKDSMLQMMKKRVNDPNLLAWMEPHGEFFMAEPASNPPNYQTRFPAYLQQEKKYDLGTVSESYTGKRDTYRSWQEVPFPDASYFAGRRNSFIDLDDLEWSWQPGPLTEGTQDGWFKPDFNSSTWYRARRDNPHLLDFTSEKNRAFPLWTRFHHDIPAEFLKANQGRKLYLHVMPFTEHEGRAISAWINGKNVGQNVFDPKSWKNFHSEFDITGALHPGDNQFAIFSAGGKITYRVFISPYSGESFPFADNQLNRRYLDWREYIVWEKLQTLRQYLQAMRAVDPNRPIKVMTPHLFQSEAMELLARYGAYPQLTGEGAGFYRPMHYKGYSRLRGLPGSSEPGGAQLTAVNTQGMFANIFWESQDIHDYVFDFSRDFWPYPEVVKWWSDNRPLLRTLGKVDFTAPKLGVLRDLRQDEPYRTHDIWNWDISRGPLPGLGLTPVLVDGLEFEKGLADNLPVLIDCASTVMDTKMIDAIRRYVTAGGVFVAMHNTGQNSPFSRNGWILASTFGLKVEPKMMNEENHNKWPVGEIKFSDRQNMLPSLRGKSCQGSGVSIDYSNISRTGAVAIKGNQDAIPIATWSDGSMAIAEVRCGKGRFIMIGTPFFLRFKDESGKWLNDDDRQKLLEEMLASFNVKRDTSTEDSRIWFERRASKNGIYDVYIAGAMGYREKNWGFTDKLNSELSVLLPSSATVIEPSAESVPDVKTAYANGKLSLGKQEFTPFQIRQFAVVRDNVGLEGPLHWLDVQRRAWRALEPVPSSLIDDCHREVMKTAADLGEDGLDISKDWKVRINPPDDGSSWLTADTGSWKTGATGSWESQGWDDAQRVQYRKTVTVPAAWLKDDSLIALGLMSYWSLGVKDGGKLWINGKLVDEQLRDLFINDITAAAKSGKLDIAIEVEAKPAPNKTLGLTGTMYLHKMPMPQQTLTLNGKWIRLENWQKSGGEINVPFKGKIFGLQRKIFIPKEWTGRPVRLFITEKSGIVRANQVGAAVINNETYFRCENYSPFGPRIDAWLKPGQDNVIEIFGTNHMKSGPFDADIQDISLAVYR
ncbi:MAG: hypothetical protein WC637_14520, partial [Victivallales bacterium]